MADDISIIQMREHARAARKALGGYMVIQLVMVPVASGAIELCMMVDFADDDTRPMPEPTFDAEVIAVLCKAIPQYLTGINPGGDINTVRKIMHDALDKAFDKIMESDPAQTRIATGDDFDEIERRLNT